MKHINKMLVVLLAVIAIMTVSCSRRPNDIPPVEKIVYVPVKDTISEKTNIARIVQLEHELYLVRDSLNIIKDSIGVDLFVARYKLGRIKYYTDIAGKGNNIKFLRGWIYRAIKE